MELPKQICLLNPREVVFFFNFLTDSSPSYL